MENTPIYTESTFEDELIAVVNEVMADIELIPNTKELRSRVSLSMGILIGLAHRVRRLEQIRKAARDFAHAAPATPPDVLDDLLETLRDVTKSY